MAITAISPPEAGADKQPAAPLKRELFTAFSKVAILGFGTVGKGVAKILCTADLPLRLTHIFNRNIDFKRVSWVPESVEWTDDLRQVLASDVDVVIEVAGGLEPARQWLQQALLAGKSVVTANKHLMAVDGVELLELARRNRQQILYGASVAGGVPVLNALEHGLAGDKLVKLAGVLNGTCNYILSNMEAGGISLPASLAKVQELGYAEADPSDDLNGMDASCKLAILARVGLKADIRPQDIYRKSIEDIQAIDFQCARELGCTIRQVSMAEIKGSSVLATVQPMLVPISSPLSRTMDNQNALVVTGKHGGETVFSGRGAGGGPTAVAIVSDLLALRRDSTTAAAHMETLQAYRVSSNFSFPYLVRFRLAKLAESLPMIRETLSIHGVEVESELEKSKRSAQQSGLAMLLKPCSASIIENALHEIDKLQGVLQGAVYLPMLPA